MRTRLSVGLGLLAATLVAVPGVAAAANHVGCDFDGNGRTDLALGLPGSNEAGKSDAGMVVVLYGAANGLVVTANPQEFHEATPGIKGKPKKGDQFGTVLACGDFDGDGFDDLAVGNPFENVNGKEDAGKVAVIYGSGSGLKTGGDQVWSQNSSGIRGKSQARDEFGAALASGDFDGDGFDDLAIGVPREDVDGATNAGAINVLYGGQNGLKAGGDDYWHENSAGIGGTAEQSDFFGQSLAAGDFNGNGRDDLAIGLPGENLSGNPDAGRVHVLYGGKKGLKKSGDQNWHQGPGILSTNKQGDEFGWSLAAADFDGDGNDDLAIGAPGEEVNGDDEAGEIHVLYGSAGPGLTDAGDQVWNQDSGEIDTDAEAFDRFGAALAAGDFDNNGRADIAIGIPNEAVGAVALAGAVAVLYGTPAGISDAGDQFWNLNSGGVNGAVAPGDLWGSVLTIGDYDGDNRADLVIGAPFKTASGVFNGGTVNTLYGAAGSLGSAGNQFVSFASLGGTIAEGDRFGHGLS